MADVTDDLVRKLTDALVANTGYSDGICDRYARVAAEVVREHVETQRKRSNELAALGWKSESATRTKEWEQRYEQQAEQVSRLRTALTAALNELGVPGPGYPAPVANAVEILRAALADSPREAKP